MLCKQFGQRSGQTTRPAWSGSKLSDTLIVFLKDFFWKKNLEKKNPDDKKADKITQHAKSERNGYTFWQDNVCQNCLPPFFFFFFFDLGFTALSRIFHLYRADRSSKVGENRSTRRKTTWPSVSRTWLSHIWPELGSNHSGEKPNGLRVNSLIH